MLAEKDFIPHCARYDSVDVLLIGAGRGGTALLGVLHNYAWVNISGLVDIDPQAPGVLIARSLGVPVYDHIDKILPQFHGDIIIDVTGNPELAEQLPQLRARDDISIISGKEAKLVYDLVYDQIRDKEQLHSKTAQLELLKTMLDISQKLERGFGGEEVINQGLEGSAKLIVSPRALAMECVEGRLELIGGIGLPNVPVHVPVNVLEQLWNAVRTGEKNPLVELDEPLRIGDIDIDFQLIIPLFLAGNLRYCLLFEIETPLETAISSSLSMLVSHLQLALEAESQQQLLRDLAYRDPLTGVHNRRYFDERLQQELERMRRSKQGNVAVMYIDLDHFKELNDTFGHGEGDHVLTVIAQAIHAKLRTYDVLARYGGDEFVAILLETDQNALSSICQRVLKSIEGLRDPTVERFHSTGRLGLSIGVAMVTPDSTMDAQKIIEHADRAMYTAKRNGRGQVRIVEL